VEQNPFLHLSYKLSNMMYINSTSGSSFALACAQANNRRMQDEADTVITEGAPHAGPPPQLDPILESEGHVMYKNLLGPGQNMSHVAGKHFASLLLFVCFMKMFFLFVIYFLLACASFCMQCLDSAFPPACLLSNLYLVVCKSSC
jgi:hypothetical protein